MAQQSGRRPAIPQGARPRATPAAKCWATLRCPALSPSCTLDPDIAVGVHVPCPALRCPPLAHPPSVHPSGRPDPSRPASGRRPSQRRPAPLGAALASAVRGRTCLPNPRLSVCSPLQPSTRRVRGIKCPPASHPWPDAHTPTPTAWLTTPTRIPLPPAHAHPHPAAVVLRESRAESGEWVLFDCSNPLCTCDGMMHAECYARLVRGSTA